MEALSKQHHKREVIRITELVQIGPGMKPLLSQHWFDDCEIFGPAVLMPIGSDNELTGNVFDVRNPDEMLWEVPVNTPKTGIIGLETCVFENCRFHGIGLAVSPDAAEHIRRGFRNPAA